jgi:hypothetical protein
MLADPASSSQRHKVEQLLPEDGIVALSHATELSASSWHRYVRQVLGYRWKIALCTALAMLITFACAKFLMTRWYQAVTLLRPASQEPQSSFSLGTILNSVTGPAAGPLGNLFGSTAQDAQELLALLGAVDFNANLAQRYKLAPIITRHKTIMARLSLAIIGGDSQKSLSRWTLYRLMQSRLDASYDDITGNFTVKFMDPDPIEAQRILSLYLESLRQKLRDRAVVGSAAAIKALETAAATTSDSLMVGQLDQLLAQQLQQLGTAEVQADFAFVVIDPPTVPPTPYSPRPLIDTAAAGILTPFLLCLWLMGRERLRELSAWFNEQST